jgi:beta-glucosidase
VKAGYFVNQKNYRLAATELVEKMTLEEKASLCSGQSFWNLQGIERLGLAPIMVTDGPHGLRKQTGDSDQLGINESVPATCFPLACASACSFDTDLMYEMGVAIAEECKQEQVSVILGPGVNLKRNPLCGRNFEYFSEDPLLSGEMGAALVKGIQSLDIGTSVKHFAANNQETRRVVSNSVVDTRAMRELYLRAFELIVVQAQPWTLMCSYNLVNGTYASENPWLLSEVPRDEWGFEGIIMSDWGATNDRVAGVAAGLDLEMPTSGGANDAEVAAAIRAGTLSQADLDELAIRISALILRSMDAIDQDYRYDAQKHQALARRAAAESSVLLKNDEALLPIREGQSVAVIGAFAKKPRYQGAGSSKINPTKIECAYDAFLEAGIDIAYADGYLREKGAQPDADMIIEACEVARNKDVVVIFSGLPEEYESEGFDRSDMKMPLAHTMLIDAIAQVNPNVVVVLQQGAPTELDWDSRVKSILVSYLGGQAVGGAEVDLLCGKVAPSGKLAETWSKAYEDTPSSRYFPGGSLSVEYRESVFVGYRYFDTAQVKPAYAFGHGLSYTEFAYSNLELSSESFAQGDSLELSCMITNTGNVEAAEVVQVYVELKDSKIFRAQKELRAFAKVKLAPQESTTVTLKLDDRAFSYYHSELHTWAIEGGEYLILVGAASDDIRLEQRVAVTGDNREDTLVELTGKLPDYYSLESKPLEISTEQFQELYGQPLPPSERAPGEPFTINSTLSDIKDTRAGKMMIGQIQKQAQGILGDNIEDDLQAIVEASVMEMPLRSLAMFSGGMVSKAMIEGIVDMANGKNFRGLIKILKNRPKGL